MQRRRQDRPLDAKAHKVSLLALFGSLISMHLTAAITALSSQGVEKHARPAARLTCRLLGFDLTS
jgi:hypothetical protein